MGPRPEQEAGVRPVSSRRSRGAAAALLAARRSAGRASGRAGVPGRGAMKLYSLSVLYKAEHKAVLLKAAYDVSSFSFFQRTR